jgi:hypothetical protein
VREYQIKFRPHHFTCTLGFQGKGYSPTFIKNYAAICNELARSPDTLIEIVASSDDICQACPHIRKNTGCTDSTKVNQIDLRHIEVLGFKIGDTIKWSVARQLIKQKMTHLKFDYACDGCEWKDLGVCLEAINKL